MSNPTPHMTRSATRYRRGIAAAVLTAAAVIAAPIVSPASAAPAEQVSSKAGVAQSTSTRGVLQRELDGLVGEGGFPAVLASVQTEPGRSRDLRAGVGDLTTGAPVPRDGTVRIGSNTKTFTAVVVLQLVEEGLVDLDAPVETYLPGLLRGEGIDGSTITVRQLLQHTSGLPDYLGYLADGLLLHVDEYKSPRTLLDFALAEPAVSAPGTTFGYSNTNFLVAGLVVEAVTERPLREEIQERVIERAGLEETSFPNVGDMSLPGRYPRAYHTDDPAAALVDVTEQDPSFGWAAGAMVSSPSDLNRFFTALLDGELMSPELLTQMKTTVPAPDFGEGAGYGLGLISSPLSCGETSWGHGGAITGYSTTNAVTEDGAAAAIATTRLPQTLEEVDALEQLLDRALCS